MIHHKYYIFLILLLQSIVVASNIDTKHLKLELQFNWNKKQAIGIAYITLSAVQKTNTIYLDAGKLDIKKVMQGNKELDFQYTDKEDDNLKIILPKQLDSNETITISIEFMTTHENRADPNALGGSFGKGLRFFEPTSTTPRKRKQIWSSGEPNGNKYWFPCNDDISDIHTTEIIATVEKPLSVFSNGKLIHIRENENKSRTFHYYTEIPIPNYLINLVVGEYIDVPLKSGKTTIHNYGYPDEKEAVKSTVVLLPKMMKFLEEKTGYNYPFDDYCQIVVQDYPYPGMIGQHGLATLSDNYIDDHGVHEDYKYLWDGVAVQALSNQWFGNLILPKSWDDVWLNNAFAQYFAGLFTATENEEAEYLLWYYPFERWNIDNDWYNGKKHPIVTNNYYDLSSFTNDSYSKFRGAHVLKMLQNELGDDIWWKAVQNYVQSNAGKQVSSKDFKLAVEKVSGNDYQWFFDQWIYKVGMPELEVNRSYDKKTKQLHINVKQLQKTDSTISYNQVEFFQGKIDIEIEGALHEINLLPKAENDYTFSFASEPSYVYFNHEETFLCNTKMDKSSKEYLVQLSKSKGVLARKQAMDQLALIYQDTTSSNILKSEIKKAFINEINSQKYWRYRMYALGSLRKITNFPYDQEMI